MNEKRQYSLTAVQFLHKFPLQGSGDQNFTPGYRIIRFCLSYYSGLYSLLVDMLVEFILLTAIPPK